MDQKIKDFFEPYKMEYLEKDIDILIKEEFEGISGIFIIPKLKKILLEKFQYLHNRIMKLLNQIEDDEIILFNPVEFFPIPQNKNCFFWHKESIFIDKTYKKGIYYIEKLDNPNSVNDSNFYKIIKQKNNSENKIETETLFTGYIKYKKDAEKLFEMLGIL